MLKTIRQREILECLKSAKCLSSAEFGHPILSYIDGLVQLDLWKDADPGLPEVADARRRLAGLTGT